MCLFLFILHAAVVSLCLLGNSHTMPGVFIRSVFFFHFPSRLIVGEKRLCNLLFFFFLFPDPFIWVIPADPTLTHPVVPGDMSRLLIVSQSIRAVRTTCYSFTDLHYLPRMQCVLLNWVSNFLCMFLQTFPFHNCQHIYRLTVVMVCVSLWFPVFVVLTSL